MQTDITNKTDKVSPRLLMRQGLSMKADACEAVRDLASQIKQPHTQVSLVYFSSDYDPKELGQAIKENLSGTVVGCTTAGQISKIGFQQGGISGASLASDDLSAISYLIHPLSSQEEQVTKIAEDIVGHLSQKASPSFGFLLVDGLSKKEESLISSLYMSLGNVQILGGSAGDGLKFEETFVYHNGKLLSDAAVFTLFSTTLPFRIFKHQHFLPTSIRLVVTESDPENRLVKEINGESAAEVYAQLLGKTVDQLNPTIFSNHPLMLRLGDEYYVRSISSVEADGSLLLFCAIDTGVVLTIGRGDSAVDALGQELEKVKQEMGEPAVILGCDCILRRLEMESAGVDEKIGKLFVESKVVGFNTYGEQINSVHVNQTFMGVAISG